MSRTLTQVFRLQDRQLGTRGDTGGREKLIRSPYGNKRMVIPSHVSDFNWANDKRITEIDINRITDPNGNWGRDNLISKKVGVTLPSIPEFDPHQKRVRVI